MRPSTRKGSVTSGPFLPGGAQCVLGLFPWDTEGGREIRESTGGLPQDPRPLGLAHRRRRISHVRAVAAPHGEVLVLTKRTLHDSATSYAQGGIAAALGAVRQSSLPTPEAVFATGEFVDGVPVYRLPTVNVTVSRKAALAEMAAESASTGDRAAGHRREVFEERRARFEGRAPAQLAQSQETPSR